MHTDNGPYYTLSGDFGPAYDIIRRNEGYYANNPADTGGETYAGIARNLWPQWPGWPIIDEYKYSPPGDFAIATGAVLDAINMNWLGIGHGSDDGPRELSNNEKIPGDDIEILVERFYRDRWNDSNAGQINSQDVANAYFDFYILASRATERMQLALRNLGYNVAVDNIMGPMTIATINQADPDRLLSAFVDQRIDFHNDMINSGIVSAQFRDGWVQRALVFDPDASPFMNPVIIGGSIVLIGGLYWLYKRNAA